MGSALGYLLSCMVASAAMLAASVLGAGGALILEFYWLVPLLLGAIFVAIVIAASPVFLLAECFARSRRITSIWYFVGAGILTAALWCGLIALWASLLLHPQDPDRIGLAVAFLLYFPSFLTSGVLGGLSYWALHRHARETPQAVNP